MSNGQEQRWDGRHAVSVRPTVLFPKAAACYGCSRRIYSTAHVCLYADQRPSVYRKIGLAKSTSGWRDVWDERAFTQYVRRENIFQLLKENNDTMEGAKLSFSVLGMQVGSDVAYAKPSDPNGLVTKWPDSPFKAEMLRNLSQVTLEVRPPNDVLDRCTAMIEIG